MGWGAAQGATWQGRGQGVRFGGGRDVKSLSVKRKAAVHAVVPEQCQIGEALLVTPGTEICLWGTGNFLPLVMETSHALPESGLSNEVIRFNTNNSVDEIGRQRAFSAFDAVVIIEKHIVSGGFRGAVAKWRNEKALHHGMFDSHRRVGLCLARGRSGMREQFSLTMKSIVEPVRPLLP